MNFRSSKGIIALDIDGTITSHTHSINSEVVKYFSVLDEEGWQFIFITGRPFQWAIKVLKQIPFVYVLAVQNGAFLLEMPSERVLDKKLLGSEILPLMDRICYLEQTDYVIYSGWENQDLCYYRLDHFNSNLLQQLQPRIQALEEKWVAVSSFNHLPISHFASLKCFATNRNQAEKLSRYIESNTNLHAPVNRDPFNESYFIIQVTHPDANKGKSLDTFSNLIGNQGPIIAAGDDYNDLTMLKRATVKVVMENAPNELKVISDIIAPPARENGIIFGLQKAIEIIGTGHLNGTNKLEY